MPLFGSTEFIYIANARLDWLVLSARNFQLRPVLSMLASLSCSYAYVLLVATFSN